MRAVLLCCGAWPVSAVGGSRPTCEMEGACAYSRWGYLPADGRSEFLGFYRRSRGLTAVP
jgi:hypothetical protein